MQKKKSALFIVAGVLTLVYVVFNMIEGILYLMRYEEFRFDFEYDYPYIIQYFLLPAAYILLSIGLFGRKRTLIVIGLASGPALSLLWFLVDTTISVFDGYFDWDSTTMNVLSINSTTAWCIALAFMILYLFRQADAPTALSPDKPAAQTRSANLLIPAAVLMLHFAFLSILYGTILTIARWDHWDYDDSIRLIISGILQPLATGILISVGLFCKKRTPILIGLALPIVGSCLYLFDNLGSLSSSLRDPSRYVYLAYIFGNLDSIAWRLVLVFTVLGLFLMIRAKKKEMLYAQPEYAQPLYPKETQSAQQIAAADDTDADDVHQDAIPQENIPQTSIPQEDLPADPD